jgi:nucleoside 2-deoxyribosyltransferase
VLKIYLGGPMFTLADITNNLRLAVKLRKHGFSVYCPNENQSINDKSRSDISAERIFDADIVELESANVFLCQVAEDSGTMWEAGYMNCLSRCVDSTKYKGCIGLATDIRLKTVPDPNKSGVDNQSMYLNQFVIGGLKLSLGVFTDEDELIQRLKTL